MGTSDSLSHLIQRANVQLIHWLKQFPEFDAESSITSQIWLEIKERPSINRADDKTFRSRWNNRGNYLWIRQQITMSMKLFA